MKTYINEKSNIDYGFAVVIVIAENEEQAQWLTHEFDDEIWWDSDMPMFQKDGWRELPELEPSYLQTEAKVVYYKSYFE